MKHHKENTRTTTEEVTKITTTKIGITITVKWMGTNQQQEFLSEER